MRILPLQSEGKIEHRLQEVAHIPLIEDLEQSRHARKSGPDISPDRTTPL